jgi:hypothetical protein
VLSLSALRDAVHALRSARNRSLADELLKAPIGDLFARLAYPATAPSNLKPGQPSWRGQPGGSGCLVVVQDGEILGVIGMPEAATADALFQRIGLNPVELDDRGATTMPPDASGGTAESAPPSPSPAVPEPEDIPKGLLDLPSGGGGGAMPGMASEEATASDSLSLSETSVKEQIRLDVATPETAIVGESFDVAVAIRQPDAPPLALEDLTKLTSTEGTIFRDAATDIVKYRVEIEAKDCEVEPPNYLFLLEKGKNSIVQYFQVTPKRAGNISIVVNAYQADDGVLAATTRVRLKASVQAVSPLAALTPTGDPAADALAVQLYDALSGPAFSLEDLQDLAFRLGVDWDILAGDAKPARARSLVQVFAQRKTLPALRDKVKELRPDTLS